jgi:hypothetical protein
VHAAVQPSTRRHANNLRMGNAVNRNCRDN